MHFHSLLQITNAKLQNGKTAKSYVSVFHEKQTLPRASFETDPRPGSYFRQENTYCMPRVWHYILTTLSF